MLLCLFLQVSNMFIVSLAIADLIVGLCVMPISAIYIFTVDWLFGVAVCQFWIGIDYTASTASILNLFILSLDRYWSVTSPLKYLRKRTKKRALIMISLVWSGSCLWLIPIIGWHHFEHGGVRTVPNDVCDTEYATNTALKIITGILNYYLPLAFMYGLYIKIFIEIHKRSLLEIGQRNVGNVVVSENPAISGSVSDDSGGCDEARTPKPSEDNTVIPNHMACLSRNSSYRNGKNHVQHTCHLRTFSSDKQGDTETDQTDSEVRSNKGGYTNMKLVRVSGRQDVTTGDSSDVFSSDSDARSPYVYDEMVCDSKSERLHRFYYGESAGSMRLRVESEEEALGNGYAESICMMNMERSAPHSRVRFCTDEDNHCDNKPLPKENHPNKNKYIKPQKYITQRIPELRVNSKPCSPSDSEQDFNMFLNNKDVICHRRSCLLPPTRGAKPQSQKSSKLSSNYVIKNNFNGSSANTKWRKKKPKNRIRPSSALTKEIKAARQLGVILGAFTLCFFPYFVCFMVVAFCESCVGPELMTAVTWIGYINSTLNPFLYPLCNATFRRKFRKMLNLKAKEKDVRRNSLYFAPPRNNHTSLHSGYSLVD